MIRKITGQQYNHVALSLNKNYNTLYSFARHYKNAPFYGGFVKESCNRYINKNKTAQIKVYAIPVTSVQLQKLARTLYRMRTNHTLYYYNMISAITNLVHKKINIKNSFTCVEFIVNLFYECGINDNIQVSKFYSLNDLQYLFKDHLLYSGIFPINISVDNGDTYLENKSVLKRVFLTVSSNAKLISNINK